MNGKNMDSMIRNLYAKIVLGGISGDAAIREREAEVDKELKSTEIELGQQEYEKFRDCALSVACTSEELGFILGMRYVISNIHRTCQGIFIIVFQQGCRPHMDGVHASGNRVFLQIHGCLHQCFRFHNSLQYAIPGWLFHCIQEFPGLGYILPVSACHTPNSPNEPAGKAHHLLSSLSSCRSGIFVGLCRSARGPASGRLLLAQLPHLILGKAHKFRQPSRIHH